jgi:hypothetical protein
MSLVRQALVEVRMYHDGKDASRDAVRIPDVSHEPSTMGGSVGAEVIFPYF